MKRLSILNLAGLLWFLWVSPVFAVEGVSMFMDVALCGATSVSTQSVQGALEVAACSGAAENTSITIQDTSGTTVATLFQGLLPEGDHLFRWEGKNSAGVSVPGGVYTLKVLKEGYYFYGEQFIYTTATPTESSVPVENQKSLMLEGE